MVQKQTRKKSPKTVGASMIPEPATLEGRSDGYKTLITFTRIMSTFKNPYGKRKS